ncbi:MAG: hypothetical protein ABI759_18380 [Candidatus Solibacter sp.]
MANLTHCGAAHDPNWVRFASFTRAISIRTKLASFHHFRPMPHSLSEANPEFRVEPKKSFHYNKTRRNNEPSEPKEPNQPKRRKSRRLRRAIFKSVRYFLTGRLPPVTSILLVESGTRGLLEGLVVGLRQAFGNQLHIDLVTCYNTLPKNFEAHNTRIYRVGDFRGRAARKRLYTDLAANNYSLVGIICSGEVVMAKWKWVIALRLAAKLFIINENGDYFWFDRLHLGALRQFVLFRSGLAGSGAVRTLVRLISFPFTILYLLLYATSAHASRALRKS